MGCGREAEEIEHLSNRNKAALLKFKSLTDSEIIFVMNELDDLRRELYSLQGQDVPLKLAPRRSLDKCIKHSDSYNKILSY